jgi:hypothetical protein
MNVEIVNDQYVLSLSRSQFFLLAHALDEHLLMRGDRFSVSVFDQESATAFSDELAAATFEARKRAGLVPADQVLEGPQHDESL